MAQSAAQLMAESQSSLAPLQEAMPIHPLKDCFSAAVSEQGDKLFHNGPVPQKLATLETTTHSRASPEAGLQPSAYSGPLEAKMPARDCTRLSLPEQSQCSAQLQPSSCVPEAHVPTGFVSHSPEAHEPAGFVLCVPGAPMPTGFEPVFAGGTKEPIQPSPSSAASAEGSQEPLQPVAFAGGTEEPIQLSPSPAVPPPAAPSSPASTPPPAVPSSPASTPPPAATFSSGPVSEPSASPGPASASASPSPSPAPASASSTPGPAPASASSKPGPASASVSSMPGPPRGFIILIITCCISFGFARPLLQLWLRLARPLLQLQPRLHHLIITGRFLGRWLVVIAVVDALLNEVAAATAFRMDGLLNCLRAATAFFVAGLLNCPILAFCAIGPQAGHLNYVSDSQSPVCFVNVLFGTLGPPFFSWSSPSVLDPLPPTRVWWCFSVAVGSQPLGGTVMILSP
ncbi:uncharacterized protein KIAA0754-like [Haplochromis burtoni]|uniref:uncharacterized protein KIAA0754-like n=1 Tax=Haplochromis burtoni TaxID=8153 RepID=UPI001C2CC659|nr:uncharacterized protein KIAA0754-like [Haplochromis burtoni]